MDHGHGPDVRPRARVIIDGKSRTVDLYSRNQDWKVAVTFKGLSKGKHRITVTPLGTKNRASTGTRSSSMPSAPDHPTIRLPSGS